MKYNGDAKKIKTDKDEMSSSLFGDEPSPLEGHGNETQDNNELDYDPAPETEMDFATEEEDRQHKKGVIIGTVIGLLMAALLIGGYVYYHQSGKVQDEPVKTTGSADQSPTEKTKNSTKRTYRTAELSIHKDEYGVWRSYAGLDKTVGYTGVVGNDTGWWYVENDLVNFKFNGIAENDYGAWIVENGKVNTDFTGYYVYKNLMYKIENGKVVGSQPLTNKATSRPATTTANNVANGAGGATGGQGNGQPTTAPVTRWIKIYGGDEIIQTGINHPACYCPDCGKYFKDSSLFEYHVNTTANHQPLAYDAEFGGLDGKYIKPKEEVGDNEVVIGYTDGVVKYRRLPDGYETTDINETDIIE